jgi:predicted permease
METLWQDLRYGARQLLRSPGFTAVAVLTLALGIGANTAIFQLLDALKLRTLPVERPHELAEVQMIERRPRSGNFNGRRPEFTNPLWEQIRDRQQAFSGIFAWGTATFNLAERGEDRFAENSLFVSGDFFNALRVRPILGRVFSPADDQRGCASPGAVISYAFWQREFGGDLSVVGKKISIDGHPFEVIGVTPAGFFGIEVGRSFDLAIPICAEAIINPEWNRLDRRNGWWLAIVGRLKPGWTLEQATAHLSAISPAILEETIYSGWTAEHRENFLATRYGAIPAGTGVSALRRQYETPLWLLLGATGLVLLIACANIANLMLARASARERELAVRSALGASRGRLIRQLLTESLLLAGTGALLGVWLAQSLSSSVVSLLSGESTPLFFRLNVDSRLLAFTAGVGVLTCLLFGLVPAVRATRVAPVAGMTGGRGLTASRERSGLRRGLVVAQVALSLVLLVGALLFGRSLYNLTVIDTGFQQEGILQLDVRYWASRGQRIPIQEGLTEALRATTGVEAVALVSHVPLGGSSWNDNIFVEGREGYRGESRFNNIGPGYFETLRIAFLGGRDFDGRDTLSAPRVAIVNEAFVRQHLNGENPLGRTFRIETGPGEPQPVFEIVGWVKNSKYEDLRAEFPPIAYLSQSQDEHPDDNDAYLIRSSLPPTDLMAAVRRTLERTHPGVSFHFHNFKGMIRESLVRDQLMATLTGFFGALAAVLASLGLYGVLSYAVVKRTNEIGIRMAMGAQARDILSLVLGDAALLLGLGLVIGTALALGAARVTRALLYGLEPSDPLTFLLGAALLAVVTAAAGYIPARRAARVDPMVALRYE